MSDITLCEGCHHAWRALDVWDTADLPERIECKECGNTGVITPWGSKAAVIPGVPEGAMSFDGYSITWTLPGVEVN
ncbi:hypothetical protein DRO27_02800 [Candidatus Bathyarchaeota archaeon]|nr:MAG: hypothetical protein DRO27_02800 [Candidatus Bathyarchaeota archaeon]